MTRNYNNKLVLLLFCHLLPVALMASQQWVGVSSQSPAKSHITTSGSTNNSAEISVEIPGFYLTETLFEGKINMLPQIPGGNPMLEQGNPDLQKLSFTLQLPVKGNMEISIVSSKYTEYTDVDIAPSAGNDIRSESNPQINKGQSYTINAFFPGEIVGSQLPYIVRNKRAQSFQVYPFQYNPVTRVLRFYSQITIKVVNSLTENSNPIVENDRRIQPVAGIGVNSINKLSSDLKAGELPSARGSMLIISPENYRKAVEPLAAWRNQTGISTAIIGSEQFKDAEALYTFVKNYYYTNPDLAYLLLVGDAEQVPTYMLPYGASDNYYAYLAGNDHYPDILVGRFSAETVKDVEVQVSRTLQYEKDPAADASWVTTATGIASTLSPGDDNESDFQHVRNLLKTLKSTSYSQYNEFFDGSQDEGDANGNPVTTDIMAKINQGTGVIFYTGHGSTGSWATGSVTKSVVESLDNNGKYPLIWSAACENGNFTGKSCLAEAWLRATNSKGQPIGALAAVMASGSQTGSPPMEAQDKIAELLSNPQEGFSTMGAITIQGMMSMNDKYGAAGFATTDTWILFGDPSLNVRTTAPKQFIVNHKGTIGSKKNIYDFTCNSATGYACISQQGTILGTAEIKNGASTIYLDYPASGGNLILTITALNYLPYIATVEVSKLVGTVESVMPLNHSRLQTINSGFSWESGDGANPDYYLFSLGTDNPPANLINVQKLTVAQFIAGFTFEYNTTYFWKVVSVNASGNVESKVMEFKTVFGPDEDFESGFKSKLSWSTGGTQSWAKDDTEHFKGTHSVRSGQIGKNEFSSMVYPCEVKTCDFVSFWSKTSSDKGDKLQFMIDGSVIDEWSGENDWNFHIYKVEAGTHQIEWRYSKDSEAEAGKDAAWLDNIHLPLHAKAFAQLPATGAVCEKSVFETKASASNYFSILWQTEGDGTFADVNLEDALYSPGKCDIEKTKATLHMKLKGFDGCPEIDNSMNITVNALPLINLPSDTIAAIAGSVLLDAGLAGNMTYNWQPSGSTSNSVLIDSSIAINGLASASVKITSPEGCSATKNIKIHFTRSVVEDTYTVFPNPSNGNFTLASSNGSSVIDRMRLVDQSGKVVWQTEEGLTVAGSVPLSIMGLASGAYYLVTENSKGHSANTVIIK